MSEDELVIKMYAILEMAGAVPKNAIDHLRKAAKITLKLNKELDELSRAAKAGTIKLRNLTPDEEQLHKRLGL